MSLLQLVQQCYVTCPFFIFLLFFSTLKKRWISVTLYDIHTTVTDYGCGLGSIGAEHSTEPILHSTYIHTKLYSNIVRENWECWRRPLDRVWIWSDDVASGEHGYYFCSLLECVCTVSVKKLTRENQKEKKIKINLTNMRLQFIESLNVWRHFSSTQCEFFEPQHYQNQPFISRAGILWFIKKVEL